MPASAEAFLDSASPNLPCSSASWLFFWESCAWILVILLASSAELLTFFFLAARDFSLSFLLLRKSFNSLFSLSEIPPCSFLDSSAVIWEPKLSTSASKRLTSSLAAALLLVANSFSVACDCKLAISAFNASICPLSVWISLALTARSRALSLLFARVSLPVASSAIA